MADKPETEVEIECTVANVHLGDGRQMGKGDTETVTPDLAKLLVDKNKQAKRV